MNNKVSKTLPKQAGASAAAVSSPQSSGDSSKTAQLERGDFPQAHIFKQVLIIGCGLLGTSLGLALRERGYEIFLEDASPTALSLALDMGAGRAAPAVKEIEDLENTSSFSPDLVIVATPPDVAGTCIISALARYRQALVTDVASVKQAVLAQVLASEQLSAADKNRYLGSHPMAGRERSGAAFARSDLFYARPWVIVAHNLPEQKTLLYQLRLLALEVGALPVELPAEQHDEAVALVSHVPQLVASLLASRLNHASEEALGLAGQGLRDTTRIAASDPRLWGAIIAGNAPAIVQILQELHRELGQLLSVLSQGKAADLAAAATTGTLPQHTFNLSPGVLGAITQTVYQGNLGVNRIPGKHGGAPKLYSEMLVVIPDRPGSLARLFKDVGEAEVNIEDLQIEHSPGAAAGVAVLSIDPAQVERLQEILRLKGWKITL